MIRVLTALMVLVCAAQGVIAAGLPVRSGEHDRFTRLVIELPTGASWTVQTSGRKATLKISEPGITFDTSAVFDRIPRTRVTDLGQAAPGAPLVLSLGCDCEVRSFVDGKRFLVVDVVETTRARTILPRPALASNLPAYRFSDNPDGAPLDPGRRPMARPETAQAGALELIGLTGVEPRARSEQPELAAAEKRLLGLVVRAANQGLLEPDLGRAKEAVRAASEDPEKPVTGRDMLEEGPSDLAAKSRIEPGIAAITGVDIASAEAMGNADTVSFALQCIEPSRLDIAAWGDPNGFGSLVGRHRLGLFGEFDTPALDAASALIRGYLHYGFGAEAIELASQFSSQDRSIFMAMARSIDGYPPDLPNPFSNQHACDGDAAMWALLSAGPADGMNVEAALRAFSRLPPHLRAALADGLSRTFLSAGETAASAQVLRMAERGSAAPLPELGLARAELERARGDSAAERRELEGVAGSGGDLAPEALIELVESHARDRLRLDEDIPDTLAAYLTEFRRSDLRPRLQRAHILALALTGQADAVLAALDAPGSNEIYRSAGDLAPLLLNILTETASDIVFLEAVLRPDLSLRSGVDTSLVLQVSRRILDMGFPSQSLAILAASPGASTTHSGALIRAEAALAQDRPNRALLDLLHLDGIDADRLRAQARLRIGAYEEAGELLSQSGQAAPASRATWLSDPRAELSADADPLYVQAAQLSRGLSPQDLTSSGDGPLAQARTLMDFSLSDREKIADLLNLTTVER